MIRTRREMDAGLFQSTEEALCAKPYWPIPVHGSRTESLCVAPSMTNGSSAWILDTVTGFNPAAFVPGIAVPPGFSVTLAAYNATADTEALRASLPSNVLPARSYPTDDPTWVSFSYRHHGPVEG